MVKIVISGAGPAGLLLAHHLMGRSGYELHIFEKRGDPDLIPSSEDRTYPIGLQGKGMASIREIAPTLESSIESFGKWIDTVSLHQGGKQPRRITRPPNFMIERNDLTRGMLQHLRYYSKSCKKKSTLTFHWDCSVRNVFLQNQTIATDNETYETFDYLVAADGANSAVRKSLADDPESKLEYDLERIPDVYKCLYVKQASDDGDLVLESNSMHGWMAGTHQIITVPLKDEYSSGVYIFPSAENPFDGMQSPTEIINYLQSKVPGLSQLVSTEEAVAFLKSPIASTWTVKCNRLTIQDRAVLIGDAAHAVSASLGQGCNSALQDVQVLSRLLEAHDDDWPKALTAYNAKRLPQAHAVHELSSYSRARTKYMRIEFMGRLILRTVLPQFLTKRMRPLPMDIMYDETLSYTELLDKCRWWTDRVKKSSIRKTKK